VDLATAERLLSATDPKALSALKNQANNPVAAKAVAEQFAALLMKNVMQGSDGTALPFAGDATGANVVSDMFATTISETVASDSKLGLADMLFHAIEAKQRAAERGDETRTPLGAPPGAERSGRSPASRRPAHGFSLQPYRQDNGLRPLPSAAMPQPAGRSSAFRPFASTTATPLASEKGASLSGVPARVADWIRASPATPSTSIGRPASARQVQSFARQLRPILKAAGRQLGVSPKILLAHAALETGWGRSVVGNNLFGIKVDPLWQGREVTTLTHEVEGGERVTREAAFRAYPSLDASVRDYVALIDGNPRYQALIGSGDDVLAYGRGLVQGGYATDTDYSSKLEAVAAEAAAAFATPSSNAEPPLWALFASPGSIE
jgi:peptidoglycan hydrolase FlgJ